MRLRIQHWRLLTLKKTRELNKASMHILDAMIMSLGLSNEDGEYLRSLHSGHNGQLRLAHYPPVPTQQLDNALLSRLPAHTDWRYVDCSPLMDLE
jgi:isopenicillin N synthase-like dioxygenase